MQTFRFHLSVIGGLSLWLSAAPAAHHAFGAEFDVNKPINLKGTITKVEWINPHGWLYLDVKRPDGMVEHWEVELGAPNGLVRRGWTRSAVPTGTEVVVNGYASKDGGFRANGREVNFPDGRKMFVGSEGTGAPESEEKK